MSYNNISKLKIEDFEEKDESIWSLKEIKNPQISPKQSSREYYSHNEK